MDPDGIARDGVQPRARSSSAAVSLMGGVRAQTFDKAARRGSVICSSMQSQVHPVRAISVA
jgi:hypothetical protein